MAAVLSGSWTANVLKNAVANPVYYAFERGLLDVGQHFLFKDCSVNEWNLTVPSRQIVTGDFGFIGTVGSVSGTSAIGAGALTPANTLPIMSSGTGINNIQINGSSIGVGVREIRLSVRGNLRGREVVDSLTSREYGRGVLDVTGSVSVYFANAALYTYFVNNTSFSLGFQIGDGTKSYTFLLPNCKCPDDPIEVSGIDADIVETFNFRALYASSIAAELQITRVP